VRAEFAVKDDGLHNHCHVGELRWPSERSHKAGDTVFLDIIRFAVSRS